MEFVVPSPPLPDDAFFAAPVPWEHEGVVGEWFTPTELARGPWAAEALHGGPPTAVLARALERAFPTIRLMRITVDLLRPVPLAGFGVTTEVIRPGRQIATTRATLRAGDGSVCAVANGIHLATVDEPLFAGAEDNSGVDWTRLADSTPGDFPVKKTVHGLAGFRDAVTMRYPPGQGPEPGSTMAWMLTVPIIAGEEPTPFQRACPAADCGNAFSRHGDMAPGALGFINPDLTIALHRDPVGEWIGLYSTSQWQPNGVGLAQSVLFDDEGPVGLAVQTMLLRPT